MSRKTRAAILVALGAPLEVDEVVLPDLGVGHVLVKIAFSGICGKQVDEVLGKRPDPYIPHLLGHEACGTVEEVGPGVRKVRPGDKVVLHWVKGPGIDSETPRITRNGSPVNAGQVTTFSQWTVASENRVTPIDADVPCDLAALLGCAVTTGMGIVNNDAGLRPGQSIAVFGVGGIGLNVVQSAALVSADPIIAVDLSDHKLAQARRFGATHTIDGNQSDPAGAIRDVVGNRGVDVAVDTVGNPAVRKTAYEVTADTGVTVFAGVPRAEETITIDTFPLHHGKRVVGSHGGNTRPEVDIPRAIRLFRAGKLKLEEQITHRFPLERVNEALDVVRRGEANRCVLEME